MLSDSISLDNAKSADESSAALPAAYNYPDVTELRVYNLCDGEAMSGPLVAGPRGETVETTFLVFLPD